MNGITDRKITPEMFLSEEPPARIIGGECEYNLQTVLKSDGTTAHYPSEYINKAAMNRAEIRSLGQFTELGSRIYQDVGHAEYCTPECLGPHQAAAADIAGIAILASIIEASGLEHRGLFRTSGSSLKDETAAERKGFTSGVHENFMAPVSISRSPLISKLLPTYYATRIATMAGIVSQNKYEYSQKSRGIGDDPIEYSLTRRTTAGKKPMALLLRDESETVGSGWVRVETRFADAPFSLAARRHALATTSLMLRICEQAKLFNDGEFDDIIIKRPVVAAHEFMSDLSLKAETEVMSGKKMSMLNISEKLAEKVLFLCERVALPEDEVIEANLWPTIIDAFRRSNPEKVVYDDFLLRNYSVTTKHYWLNRLGAFDAGDAVAKTRSLQWDRVLPIGNGRRLMETLETNPEVEALKKAAPLTRAAIRSQFIIASHDIPGASVPGWNAKALPGTPQTFFSDPYGYRE